MLDGFYNVGNSREEPSPLTPPPLWLLHCLRSGEERKRGTMVEDQEDFQDVPISYSEAPELEIVQLSDGEEAAEGGSSRFPEEVALASALADVAECRQKLAALGERPDHVAVEQARHAVSLLDAKLHKKLHELSSLPLWRASDLEELERQIRFTAETEKMPHNEILELDELHQSFEFLLSQAEENLVKISESHDAWVHQEDYPSSMEEDGMNTEVINILKQAAREKNLAELDLQAHDLKRFPECIVKFTTLIALDISYNDLKELPDALGGLVNLQVLNAEDNALETLPDSIGLLKNLRGLNVSKNMLAALPESILQCSLLVHLEAGFNRLLYLPTSIGYHLVNLEHLAVQLNKLRALPSSICKLKSLQYLDVNCNHLKSLPENLGNLKSLEILNASSNFSNLDELPDSIGDLCSLIDLNLSYNQIRALPDSFGRLQNLRTLKLEENPLIIPPMHVVQAGVDAVKAYMKQRWESRSEQQHGGAVSNHKPWERSTSWMSRWFVGASENKLACEGKSFKWQNDGIQDYLQQQL